MPKDRLQGQAADCFKRLAAFMRAYPDIRAHIDAENELHDGYPTSVIGAGDPPAAPVVVYEGDCREKVDKHTLETLLAITDPLQRAREGTRCFGKRWMQVATTGECSHKRPCDDHDRPVRLTSTEANALARRGSNDDRIIETALNSIKAALDKLVPVQARHQDAGPEPARCNAGFGREGNEEWANPPLPSLTLKCERWADVQYFGMCKECFDSEQVWRTARGLEPRERASDPLAERGVTRGARGRFTAA